MNSSKTILYDGTFNGFLTVIYQVFDQNWSVMDIQKQGFKANELFSNTIYVKTEISMAKKVWYGINQRNHKAIRRIYYAYLSERKQIETVLYNYINYVMDCPQPEIDITEVIDLLDQLSGKVEKEKKRMEAFTQFQLVKENNETANMSPKYNVLPLLSKHLRHANKGKDWSVFDDKRKYGLRCTAMGLELISNKAQVRTAV